MVYTHWRNNSKWLLVIAWIATAALLSSCAALSNILGRGNTPDAPAPRLEETTAEEKTPRAVSTQFEWAVQYYEAGQYEQALTSFRILEREGAKVPSFELIPFYQGMSYMNLDLHERAIPFLERFVKAQPQINEAQEARIALLLCYEAVKNWKALSATAAEVEKFPLYTENKTLLRLLWAEALLEQNERQGAKKNLADAGAYLNNIPAPNTDNLGRQDEQMNEDLFGRYAWINARIGILDCQKISPQASAKKNKKKRFFIETWVETGGRCLAKATELALASYSSLSPRWAQNIAQVFITASEEYSKSPQRLVEQKFFSNPREALAVIKPSLRQELYNQSAIWRNYLRNFQYQTLSKEYLQQTVKHFEHLIYQLSLPSS